MKTRLLIIGIVLATIGLTTYSFVNKEQANNTEVADNHSQHCDQSINTSNFFAVNYSPLNKPVEKSEIMYMVRANYTHPTNSKQLKNASLVGDLIPDYPTNWINDYVSVEIITTNKNRDVKAISENDVLNKKQKNILSSADLNSNIIINVRYNTKNEITNEVEFNQMNYVLTRIPEVAAEFAGGYDEMIAWLRENSNDALVTNYNDIGFVAVEFTVDEQGEIEDVKLKNPSGIEEIDQSSIELISKMPAWNPAKNSKGKSVKQYFEFLIGLDGC